MQENMTTEPTNPETDRLEEAMLKNHFRIDMDATMKSAIQILSDWQKLINYQDLFNKCFVMRAGEPYSSKTRPVEMFRSQCDYHNLNTRIRFGLVGLRRWARDTQLCLLGHAPFLVPCGHEFVALATSYAEVKVRTGSFINNYGDSFDVSRRLRATHGLMVERLALGAFERIWKGRVQHVDARTHDFIIRTGSQMPDIKVDIKTPTTGFRSDQGAYCKFVVPEPEHDVYYILADYERDNMNLRILGWMPGRRVARVGQTNRSYRNREEYNVSQKHLSSWETFAVLAHSAVDGHDYISWAKER